MPRLTLTELELRCQKPSHRQVGNWMARRVARPLALRITWLVAPWGISAHAMTLAAWLTALCAVAAFGFATVTSWLIGALLLQIWYLLDHVDGQLARYHGTASLDGVQLDYLMHHTVNLLLPIGLGWGLANTQVGKARLDSLGFGARDVFAWPQIWQIAGLAAGVALLLIGLRHDARYKAFVQRLKRVHGELIVIGGGGARPASQPAIPRGPLRLTIWLARKFCELHVVMNVVLLMALRQWLLSDASWIIPRVYLLVLALLALTIAVGALVKSVHEGESEREFQNWYQVPSGHELVFQDGWWHVQSSESAENGEVTVNAKERLPSSS